MEIILLLKGISALGMTISLIVFLYTAFDWKAILQKTYHGNDIIYIYKVIPIDRQAKFIILKIKNKLIVVFVAKNYARLIYEIDYEDSQTIV